MITYRKSNNTDKQIIAELLKTCFGDREKYGALNGLETRYLLAFDGDQLIAMTGVDRTKRNYDGAEIDWTCILPGYRGNGIIFEMLRTELIGINENVYCSCWRQNDNQYPNLHYSMDKLGFVCVKPAHKQFKNGASIECADCISCFGGNCHCCEDLYVKVPSSPTLSWDFT